MSQEFHFRRRPRRLRATAATRALVRENRVTCDDLVQPLFVIESGRSTEAIESMPGQYRYPPEALKAEVAELLNMGIRSVALFPSIDRSLKDDQGSEALNESSLILRTISSLRKAFPELVIIADIALDPYTAHGHDGVLTSDGSDVDNDRTVAILCKMALLHAQAGVSFVAPSDMMDGRIGAIRDHLDAHGFEQTGIIAYAAKFNSAFYGPFRDAVGSASAAGTRLLGKDTYQLDPANRRQAGIELELDEEEGADMLMVKPAGPYLDIIRDARESTLLPVVAYQVSGEYAQIHAAARLGWLDYQRTRDESLLAIKRAGADIILTYFAREMAAESQGIKTAASHDQLEEYNESGGI